MTEHQRKIIDEINNERIKEIEIVNSKKNADNLMESMKLIYDSAIKNGFTDYQSTVYANTYFNVLMVDSINKSEESK